MSNTNYPEDIPTKVGQILSLGTLFEIAVLGGRGDKYVVVVQLSHWESTEVAKNSPNVLSILNMY